MRVERRQDAGQVFTREIELHRLILTEDSHEFKERRAVVAEPVVEMVIIRPTHGHGSAASIVRTAGVDAGPLDERDKEP